MSSMTFEIATRILVLLFSALAIIFAFGVVWRVEKKLDIAFKLFLAAIIAFFAGEFSGLFYIPKTSFLIYAEPAAKILFALLFLAGMAQMRSMIRRIDGEK